MDKVIDSFSERIVNYFISRDLIKSEKKRLYQYSMTNIIQSSICIAATLLIGLCLGMFWENLVFFIVFKILRKYSGGLHAGKYIYCLLFSLTANLFFMLAIKYLQSFDSDVFILGIELFSLLIAAIFSPLENKNKKINSRENMVYKLMTIGISFVLVVISYLLVYFNNLFVIPVGTAMFFSGILLLAGKISFYVHKRKLYN